MRGSQMKTEHTLKSDNGICLIARNVNTIIPLGDETINSSLVERGRSLMDPQPHPPCTSSSEWNRHPRVPFFRSPKMWKSQGEDLDCTEDVEVFLSQISEAYLSPDWQYGTGVIMQKVDSVWQHSRAFWLYGASQHSTTKKQTKPLCPSLLASISNVGRTHFTLR